LRDYQTYPFAGFIEGVELRRWGWPYVGGWRADDVYEPTNLESVMPPEDAKATLEPIAAGGFYCYLSRAQTYFKHDHAPEGRAYGPEIAFGIALRQQGLVNYLDWSVKCAHYRQDGTAVEWGLPNPVRTNIVRDGERWRQ
jgi:hypothetical protein